MPVRVGINGFGRIGRNVFRAAYESGADIEWLAVNDLVDPKTIAHLLKYDSNYGPFPGEVEATDTGFKIDGREIRVLAERDPAALPWGELGAGDQPGRDRRARRQLRRGLRPRQPPGRLKRVVHHQLPGPGGEGAAGH